MNTLPLVLAAAGVCAAIRDNPFTWWFIGLALLVAMYDNFVNGQLLKKVLKK